ncbi:Uncharacterized protein dnm_051090 [Desulfonema magnum]|uniref:Uncharacterized protein n=1 Tax=Desulfonema magnum TaxID=45655 RepID=A0A975BP51_9BACT|nr:Uncharacterized protein dnm_051090 [Desulfonema magnum]
MSRRCLSCYLVGAAKKPGFFPRPEGSPRRKKPGFFPVRRVCPATARKLFDLLSVLKLDFSADYNGFRGGPSKPCKDGIFVAAGLSGPAGAACLPVITICRPCGAFYRPFLNPL